MCSGSGLPGSGCCHCGVALALRITNPSNVNNMQLLHIAVGLAVAAAANVLPSPILGGVPTFTRYLWVKLRCQHNISQLPRLIMAPTVPMTLRVWVLGLVLGWMHHSLETAMPVSFLTSTRPSPTLTPPSPAQFDYPR